MANLKINPDSLKVYKEVRRHKVQDGSNLFRILPPLGENSNGYPYYRWLISWGFPDPETGRPRPVPSLRMTEESCPIYDYVDKLAARVEKIAAERKTSGLSEEAIKEELREYNEVVNRLRPRATFFYNAVNKAGEVGVLELKKTAHDQMKTEMHQYILDYNQDPTSVNSLPDDSGVWFNITRTGSRYDTKYTVKKNQIKSRDPQTGRVVFVDDQEELPATVVERWESLAYDLQSLYKHRTREELEQLVKEARANIEANYPELRLEEDVNLVKSKPTKVTSVTLKTSTRPRPTLKLDEPVATSKSSSLDDLESLLDE
jgi:hypothetical protein